MIQVTVTEHEGRVESLEITGHSGSARSGRDLVCAAVSGIAFGLCNAMDLLVHSEKISVQDNLIRIENDHTDAAADTILRTGVIQLETVAEQNSRFIKINKLEV